MALNKITSKSIETGAITADDLHTTLDFSTKTFTMHNNHITETMVTQHSAPIIAQITDSAPTTLDTLNELAAALGDDPNFATTVTNSIATKLPLAGGTITGNLEINTGTNKNIDITALSHQTVSDMGVGLTFSRTTSDAPLMSVGVIESDKLGLMSRSGIKFLLGGTNNYQYTSEAMTINNLGNVGIGTSSPSQNLHVSSSDHTRVLVTAGTDKYAELQFENDAQKFAMGVQDDNKFFLYNSTGTSQVLTVDTSSNVGIGTQSPSYKFHAVDDSSNTDPESDLGVYYGFLNSNAGVDTGSAIMLGSNNNSGAIIYGQRVGSNNEHKMGFQTRNSSGSANTRMTITGDGNVGIGTGAPSTLFDLETPGNTVDGGYYSTMTINNTGSGTWSRLRFDRSNSAKWGISLGTDDKLKISNLDVNGGGTANDGAFVIDNTGSIGMNTQTPAAQLHINKSSTPAAGTTDTDQLVAFTVDGNSHGRIDLHTTSKNATRRSAVYRPSSSTAYGFGISAYNMATLDIGRVDQGYTWNGYNSDGEYTGGITQQPRYTRKAHFSGQIIGNNTYYTIAENMNDTRFTIECFCGDASSRDYKKYAGYYTSTGYGVYGLNQLLHSNGGWNSGSFDMRVSAPNGNLSIDLRFSSYYNSANVGSWICIYTGFV